ncbi:MAG: hypothetical protein JOZ39_06155 [Chloroflexi bacterium]|nr:hypothetical protein [Chloroflexota bacterium]
MADDEVSVKWAMSQKGIPRGFHEECATWLGLETLSEEPRKAFHTEICRGCGRFLLTPAPDKHGSKPLIDPKELLK